MPARVAVLGCGKMGAAAARNLAGRGHAVHVWNRSPAAAEALRTHGCVVAASPKDALESVGAGGLCLALLSTTDAMVAVVDSLKGAACDGAILANLTSGSPDDGRRVARKAADACPGALYVDGASFGPSGTLRSSRGDASIPTPRT